MCRGQRCRWLLTRTDRASERVFGVLSVLSMDAWVAIAAGLESVVTITRHCDGALVSPSLLCLPSAGVKRARGGAVRSSPELDAVCRLGADGRRFCPRRQRVVRFSRQPRRPRPRPVGPCPTRPALLDVPREWPRAPAAAECQGIAACSDCVAGLSVLCDRLWMLAGNRRTRVLVCERACVRVSVSACVMAAWC